MEERNRARAQWVRKLAAENRLRGAAYGHSRPDGGGFGRSLGRRAWLRTQLSSLAVIPKRWSARWRLDPGRDSPCPPARSARSVRPHDPPPVHPLDPPPVRPHGAASGVPWMAMEDFVDYYELMQISPSAELTTIQRVYRMLAARYHPDNPETGSTDKFVQLQKAYEVLSDPDQRATYDSKLSQQSGEPMPVFEMKEFVVGIDAEVNRRLGVLCLLYNRRRSNGDKPGLSVLDMETKMALPREYLEFTIWYLKEKELVWRDESTSEILISCKGIDFVEQNLPASRIVYKLLKSAGETEGHTKHAQEDR
jgi:curved DNA-binding protein